MSSTTKICERLIQNGRIEGMQERLNNLYAHSQMSTEEYNRLTDLLNPKKIEEVNS